MKIRSERSEERLDTVLHSGKDLAVSLSMFP